jgi:hypothetical protein
MKIDWKNRSTTLMGIAAGILIIFVPSAKLGYQSLFRWGDQILFLNTQKEYMQTGSSSSFSKGLVGPGYALLVRVFGFGTASPEVGLVLLSIFSFSVVYFVLTKLMMEIKGINFYIASAMLMSTYLLLGIVYVKDIPWTHFPTAAIIVLIIYLMIDRKKEISRHLIVGVLFGFLLQLRTFEALAIFIAVATSFLLSIIIDKKRKHSLEQLKSWFYFICATLVTVFAISRLTRSPFWFTQYSGLVPKQDFSLTRLFHRLIQLFYNPSFNALPDSTNFTWLNVFSGIEKIYTGKISVQQYFNSPLSLHQPLLIPLNITCLWLVIRYLMPRYRTVENAQIIWISAFSAIIIQAGYLTNPFTSPGTLRYLIFREFILPQFLIILSVILHLRSSNSVQAIKTISIFLSLSLILSVSLSFLPKPQLANYQSYAWELIDSNCKSSKVCTIEVTASRNGRIVKISNQPIEVRARCDGKIMRWFEKSFTINFNGHCKGETLKVQVLPLSFGNAGTPDGETYFQDI